METPSPPKHMRFRSSESFISNASSSGSTRDDNDEDGGSTASAPSLTSTSSSSYSSLVSPGITTPRNALLHSRYASHESLYSPNDKFTQMPTVSPRERRSSAATLSAMKKRKSLASLHAPGASTPSGSSTPSRRRSSLSAGGLLAHSSSNPNTPSEGKRLSRKHVEASRRAAKEALEEDLRALDLVGGKGGGASIADGSTEAKDDYARE